MQAMRNILVDSKRSNNDTATAKRDFQVVLLTNENAKRQRIEVVTGDSARVSTQR